MPPLSPAPPRSFVGERVGRYTLTRPLAAGGMGVVYEALHEDIGHRAAVKVLAAELARDPKQQDYVERFLGEARAVNLVQHPGIVRIFDFGRLADGAVYIMMELLDGESLWERLHRRRGGAAGGDGADGGSGTLGPAGAVRVLRQLAGALAAAHARGIVHRDLKPENVILVSDPEAPGGERTKLLDFGIAKFLDSPQRMTTAGMVMGTALYMSPEQCQGAEQLDGKADAYALGVMLYELCAGRPPFDGDAAQVMRAHLFERPRPLGELCPGLPAELYALCEELLCKDPAARPSMAQAEERLGRLERSGALPQGASPSAPGPGGGAPAATRRTQLVTARREQGGLFLSWPLLLLGLLGIALLPLGLARWASRAPAPPEAPAAPPEAPAAPHEAPAAAQREPAATPGSAPPAPAPRAPAPPAPAPAAPPGPPPAPAAAPATPPSTATPPREAPPRRQKPRLRRGR